MANPVLPELEALLTKWKAAIDASPDETLPLARVRQSALRSCYNDLAAVVLNHTGDDHG